MKTKLISIALIAALLIATLCIFVGCNEEEKETIVVGYTLYEPMNYEDANGNLVGFDTDLAKAVFEDLGYNVEFKLIDWGNKYIDLNAGTIDCVWNGFTANSADDDGIQRSEKVDFSYNYMLNAQAVVVKTSSNVTDAAGLNGLKGYAEDGSAGESYMNTIAGVQANVVTYQTDALLQLKSGACQFVVVDYQLANSIVGKGDYADCKIAYTAEDEFYAIGFKKGSDLTAKVNASLEKLAANGTIATIAATYGVEGSVITDFSSQK